MANDKYKTAMSCVQEHYPQYVPYMTQCIQAEHIRPILLHKCAKQMECMNDPPIRTIPTNLFTVNLWLDLFRVSLLIPNWIF